MVRHHIVDTTAEWRNGRRRGFKIPRGVTLVRVRVPPRPVRPKFSANSLKQFSAHALRRAYLLKNRNIAAAHTSKGNSPCAAFPDQSIESQQRKFSPDSRMPS